MRSRIFAYFCVHDLLRKLPDLANSAGSSLLELDAVHNLVEVNCVISASRLHRFGGFLLPA